jgi:putative membrane protein
MKLYRTALLVSAAAFIGLAGCATRDQDGSTMLSSADQTFLENAAQGSYAEIQGSQMALDKSTSTDVRSFAQLMIKDHTAANQKLSALAKRKGYNPPTGPSVIQATELKTLGLLSGNTFDKTYVDRIGVAAHEATIRQFEKAASDANDSDIRTFARTMLPDLRHHLEMAQLLNQKQKSQ